MTAHSRAAFIILSCLAATACTSTQSRVSTSYYVISGSTGADLDREIGDKGPLEGHALASAAIKFVPVTVRFEQGEDGCKFTKATFRVDADITLPRWRQHVVSSDESLKTAWRNLSAYARAHEEVHVRIAETYAVKLGEALMEIPAKKDCDALQTTARKVVDKVQRDHDKEQNRFDAAEQKRLAKFFDS